MLVWKQTEADPYKDLKGMSKKGQRGLTHESFEECVMFHLLTVFPNKQVGVRLFIQQEEQLNTCVAQLPYWYHSPSYVTSMTPANVPFTEADLASHVLWMCPHQWQDQYNLQGKGMTPMDMRTLLASLNAIERVCTHKKAHLPSEEKASQKNKAGAKRLSTGDTLWVPKKVRFEKSCKLCKKHGGAHTMHATKKCSKYKKDGTLKANFHTAKKAGKKPSPAKQSLAQLSRKLNCLEKTMEKASQNSKKRHRDDSDSDSK
jgi:hypothetical protein